MRSLMRISVLLLFYLLGCSSFKQDDVILTPYVEMFAKDMELDKSDIRGTIIFESLGSSKSDKFVTIGVCNYLTGNIRISPRHWFSGFESEKRKMALIYHELGHCTCFLEHAIKIKMPDDCPSSLMEPILVSNLCLQRHWEMYVRKLKRRCK